MTNVFKGIDASKAFEHGWLSPVNERHMTRLFAEMKPKRIVEVGSWCGKSLLYMAKLAPDAELYPVDPWVVHPQCLGFVNSLPPNGDVWDIFRANVVKAGVEDRVHPIRMKSVDAAWQFGLGETYATVDFIYVDASHDEPDVVADIVAWWPHLRIGGIMCGDDFDPPWPGVEPAVRRIFGDDFELDRPFWWKKKCAPM